MYNDTAVLPALIQVMNLIPNQFWLKKGDCSDDLQCDC